MKSIVIILIALLFQISVCGQKKSATPNSGYNQASYSTSQAGTFMKTWFVAGPIPVSVNSSNPDAAQQEKVFKEDLLSPVNVAIGKPLTPVQVNQKPVQWKLISSANDAVVLDTVFGKTGNDFVYAYALAEVQADQPGTMMLGLGSDDGVKVWLNGKLVHENWIPRGINKDEDLVPLHLVKGSNQVLLKVQDMQGGWGFMVRLLDKGALSEQLVLGVQRGDVDKVNQLIESGADINAVNSAGITPVMAAQIAGQQSLVEILKKKGAKEEEVPSAEKLVDAMYASLKNKDASGIAVLVSKDGKVLYEKGFGYADIKSKKPVTKDTKFRIGSVTKQFTAAAILKLQENGLVSINDKLSKYIPDFPRGGEVTIHHLLTHTSGIHSYTGKPEFINRVTGTISEDSLISFFKHDAYDFNPGENFMYNNSGYFLLGYIIGKVSGMPYGEYLKKTFFDPLGMKNTGLHYAGIKLENEAQGYATNNGKYEEALNWDMSWAGAAGALYSTLEDLDKWNNALYSGKVLNESSMKAALTVVQLKNGTKPQMNYGYGLVTGNYRGFENIGHSGGLHGFITQLIYFPKQKMTVVMYSNNANPQVNFDPNKVAEAFAWQEMDKQVSKVVTEVPLETLQLYTGRYDFGNGAVMMITTSDNKLFAQLTGQARFEIFPSSQEEFFWKVVDARIKFIKNERGEIGHASFTQNGNNMNVAKLKEEVIVPINPALLDGYTGRFKYVGDMVVTITKENNKLFAQATGQGKLEMFPVSDTEFVLQEINARITFLKDDSGKVNKFKLRLNGADTELPRIE
jgi:CubicO group peptidase (beta-lactamase class C family)